MHSDNTVSRQPAFQTPSCHLCPQRGITRAQHTPNGSCLRVDPGVAQRTGAFPFPKELETADYRPERTGSCGTPSPSQVYAEDIRHPCYSWGDARPARWDRPSDSPHAPCTGVREIRRKCGCVQRWYYPEHPFNGSHVLPPLKVRGQRYYRAHDLQEPQWDNVHAPAYNGHCQRRRVSFQNHGLDRPETSRQSSPIKPHCNGTKSAQTAFFPTEVPQSKLAQPRPHGPTLKVSQLGQEIRASQGEESLEDHDNRRKSHGTVRDKIKQVVTELEEVLGGLKQVQLEMKEVVTQIDVLTSHIDLSEEEPSLFNGLQNDRKQTHRTEAVALARDSNGNQEVSPKAQRDSTDSSHPSAAHSPFTVDSLQISSPPVKRNHTHTSDQRSVQHSSEPHRTNGTCVPHRTPKITANGTRHLKGELECNPPPPYPQNGQVNMRTPTCPGKHKTLSSTVV